MQQFENKTNGRVALEMSRTGIRNANKAHDGEQWEKRRKAKDARNAYRRAIGLPEVK